MGHELPQITCYQRLSTGELDYMGGAIGICIHLRRVIGFRDRTFFIRRFHRFTQMGEGIFPCFDLCYGGFAGCNLPC